MLQKQMGLVSEALTNIAMGEGNTQNPQKFGGYVYGVFSVRQLVGATLGFVKGRSEKVFPGHWATLTMWWGLKSVVRDFVLEVEGGWAGGGREDVWSACLAVEALEEVSRFECEGRVFNSTFNGMCKVLETWIELEEDGRVGGGEVVVDGEERRAYGERGRRAAKRLRTTLFAQLQFEPPREGSAQRRGL